MNTNNTCWRVRDGLAW